MSKEPDQVITPELVLEQLRNRYESGSRDALLDAVLILLSRRDIETPDWVHKAWGLGCARWKGFFCRSLGEAFGIERPKNMKLPAARLWAKKGMIWQRVKQLNKQMPIDRAFASVAKEFRTNKTNVSEMYYAVEKRAKERSG